MIFEVLKWNGRAWVSADLLIGSPDLASAWETLYWLGVCERDSWTHSLRYAGRAAFSERGVA
jgi:hypothetical protein